MPSPKNTPDVMPLGKSIRPQPDRVSGPPGARLRNRFVTVLDVVLLALPLWIVSVVLVGRFDRVWIADHHVVEPLLALALLLPLRVSVGGAGPVSVRLSRSVQRLHGVLGRWRAREHRLTEVVLLLCITRIPELAVAFLANVILPAHRLRNFYMPFESEKLAEIFAAWDSGWYFAVARYGYYTSSFGQSDVAFFPLYPLLIRTLTWPFEERVDQAIWVSGVVVSVVALTAAMLALYRLAEEWLGSRAAARRTILYLAVFPFSFFFTRVYTESVFLLVSVMAVAGAYRGRWWSAGVWGALTALTRPNGILIGLPLFLMAVLDRPGWTQLRRRLTALSLVPAGLGLYCLYCWNLTGDPLYWLNAEEHWDYSVGNLPWEQLVIVSEALVRDGFEAFLTSTEVAPYQLVHGVVGVLGLALTPLVFQRLGPAMGAYVLVSLLVPLSGSELEGIGRYTLVLFPLFMAVATIESSRLRDTIVIVSTLFLALFSALFVTLHRIY
jgi:Gpi18-like mannosyltransferase